MQHVSVASSEYTPAAEIRMLPVIDLNPNDLACIYSTLIFVERQAKQLNMDTACITFDQPLCLKAVNIALTERLNVVCHLGGFRVIMSYLGAVGSIMAGSGLAEALQTCYGPVTVSHMLSGKAVSRSVRGHMLADGALHTILLQDIVANDQSVSGKVTDDLRAMYRSMLDGSFVPHDDASLVPDSVEQVHAALVDHKKEAAE